MDVLYSRVGWLFAALMVLVLVEYSVVPLRLTVPPPHSVFYDDMAADGERYAIVDLPLTREAGRDNWRYALTFTTGNEPIELGEVEE